MKHICPNKNLHNPFYINIILDKYTYKTITLYIVKSNFHVHKLIHKHNYLFIYLIGNIRIIIDEEKKKKHQCVHENEHSKAQNRTPQKTIKKLN